MSRLRVMVVDEHEAFREKVSRLVAEQGWEAYPAADGIDALRQIYDVMPQLIVSDAALANLSGFEFLPFVKRRFPSIGVIAVGEPVRSSKFAADMLLPKQPWNDEAFLESMEDLLSRCPLAAKTEDVNCA